MNDKFIIIKKMKGLAALIALSSVQATPKMEFEVVSYPNEI